MKDFILQIAYAALIILGPMFWVYLKIMKWINLRHEAAMEDIRRKYREERVASGE